MRFHNRMAVYIGMIAVLLSLFVFQVQPTFADGNNVLARSQRFSLFGHVVAEGVELRGRASGDIVLNTIPQGAAVEQAFLYWATLGSANTFTTPTLNGTEVSGQLIGRSADPCTGLASSFTYRADVTDLVNGNGVYTVARLPRGILPNAGNVAEGASLVVVYSLATAPFRTILIADGAVTLDFDAHTYTYRIDGYRTDVPVTDAHITYILADGQSEYVTGALEFNTQTIDQRNFTGVNGDYWDTLTYNVTDLAPTSPSATTLNNNLPGNPNSPDCLVWAATVFSVTSPVPEGMNQLAPFVNTTLQGDVAVAGTGLWGSGEGDIFLTGVPQNGTVTHAYLYWATVGSEGTFTNPSLDGTQVDGHGIGTGSDPCRGADNSYVYRAEVTALVQSNGTYHIADLPGSLLDGNDTEGAALVVLYTAPQRPYRTVIVNDGLVVLDLNNHTYTDVLRGFNAEYPQRDAHITYMIADGQSQWVSGNVRVNKNILASNVFNGTDGQYWGTVTFDVTGLLPTDPTTTTINNNVTGSDLSPDCMLWVGTVFSLTTQSETGNTVLPISIYIPIVSGE